MKRGTTLMLAMLALWVGATLRSGAATLGIGDPAPKIVVKEFVKGTPVTEFAKGKIYVVEFWATWCGPCKVSIPHITDLAQKNKDVTFVGVSVFEADPSLVKPFVASMGSKMDYRVAMDSVPPGGTRGSNGKMAVAWMEAAAQEGIPTAFIVDKTGQIAWIGHPMAMDKPLSEVVAGTWDIKAAKAEMDKQQAMQKKLQALNTKLQQAGKDPAKALVAVNEALAEDATLEPTLASLKFRLLLATQPDADATADYMTHLTDTILKNNEQGLNSTLR